MFKSIAILMILIRCTCRSRAGNRKAEALVIKTEKIKKNQKNQKKHLPLGILQ